MRRCHLPVTFARCGKVMGALSGFDPFADRFHVAQCAERPAGRRRGAVSRVYGGRASLGHARIGWAIRSIWRLRVLSLLFKCKVFGRGVDFEAINRSRGQCPRLQQGRASRPHDPAIGPSYSLGHRPLAWIINFQEALFGGCNQIHANKTPDCCKLTLFRKDHITRECGGLGLNQVRCD